MAETSPNPHNEAKVVEMTVRADQSEQTNAENIAQTPSTRDGNLDPSVGEGVAGGVADYDSMFNQADPQVKEMEAGARSEGDKRRHKNRDKKTA